MYISMLNRYNVTKSLKKEASGNDNQHTMSIVVDMKRRSPTVSERKNVVEYSSAGKFGELLVRAKVDALLVNTDEMEYGGAFADLKETARAVRAATSGVHVPACINKEIIIHPVQVTTDSKYSLRAHKECVELNPVYCTLYKGIPYAFYQHLSTCIHVHVRFHTSSGIRSHRRWKAEQRACC